jgi:hypothetical protein
MNRLLTLCTALLLTAGLLLPSQAVGQVNQATDGTTPSSKADGITVIGDEEDDEESDATAEGTESASSSAAQEEPSLEVNVGGSLRFNALFRSYESGLSADTPINEVLSDGGFTFDTFRINASGSYGGLIFDTEYAIYPESFGGMFLHHGWVGYEFSDNRQIQVGVSQVPFGIQPYASSSWFFNSTYYVGLEDDYDAGVKAIYTPGNWELKGAYYMNSEQTDFFAGNDFARYSYDVAPVSAAGYQVVPGEAGNAVRPDIVEENQFNAKVAYTFDHGDLGSTKVGASFQRGQLLNRGTGESDWHAAYALHLQGRYAGFEAKLQFAQQELNPPLSDQDRAAFQQSQQAENQDNDGISGVDYAADDFVVMGAYAFPQRVASEHNVYSSSLAYRIPVDLGPISQIKPYYDFSAVTKNVDGWRDNVTHDVGFLTTAGPLYVYTDLNISKGHPFNHPFDGFSSVMAERNNHNWNTAFNMNIGLYV